MGNQSIFAECFFGTLPGTKHAVRRNDNPVPAERVVAAMGVVFVQSHGLS